MTRLITTLCLVLCLAVSCTQSRAEVAEEALTALEQEGTPGLLPYLTRDGRRFIESLELEEFGARDTGVPIRCTEDEGPADAGWRWVTCVQGSRSLRVAVVDTGRGPRLDPFRWAFDSFTDQIGEISSEALP